MLLDQTLEKSHGIMEAENHRGIDEIVELQNWSLVELFEERAIAVNGFIRYLKTRFIVLYFKNSRFLRTSQNGYEKSAVIIKRRSSRIVQCSENTSYYLVGRINEEDSLKCSFLLIKYYLNPF